MPDLPMADPELPTAQELAQEVSGGLSVEAFVPRFLIYAKLKLTKITQGNLLLLWRDWTQETLRACATLDEIETVYLFFESCQKQLIFDYTKESAKEDLLTLAATGKADAIAALLREPNVDINQKDEDGYTALQLAAKKGHTAVVNLLLAHAPNQRFDQKPKFDGVYAVGGGSIRRGLLEDVGRHVLLLDSRRLYRSLCTELRKKQAPREEEVSVQEEEPTEISELVPPPKRPKKEDFVWKGRHKHYAYRQMMPEPHAFIQGPSFFAPAHPYPFFHPGAAFPPPNFRLPNFVPPFALPGFPPRPFVPPPSFPFGAPGFPPAGPGFPSVNPGFPSVNPGFPSATPGFPSPTPGFPAGPGFPSNLIGDELLKLYNLIE